MADYADLSVNPELFDLPGTGRTMRIWRAFGEVGRGKQAKIRAVWVQASTEMIAKRVGRDWLKTVHRASFSHIISYSWSEYAEALRRAGWTVT